MDLRDFLHTGEGSSLTLHNLRAQDPSAVQLAHELSDCDYEIVFADAMGRMLFCKGFCFSAEDYRRAREAKDFSEVMDQLGLGGYYDRNQKAEQWWETWRPGMQQICSERLFGPQPTWKIWSLNLSPMGVLIEYHRVDDVTKTGRVFVQSSVLMFDLKITPRHLSNTRKYILNYSNSYQVSQNRKAGTMHIVISNENNTLKDFTITDYFT